MSKRLKPPASHVVGDSRIPVALLDGNTRQMVDYVRAPHNGAPVILAQVVVLNEGTPDLLRLRASMMTEDQGRRLIRWLKRNRIGWKP